MEKTSKLVWHQVILILVLLFLTAVRLITRRWNFDIDLFWWWLGGVVGFLFVFSDRLIHSLVSNPKEILSVKVRDLIGRGRIAEGLALTLLEREKQENLMMRSALFIVVWLILAFWTATSIANNFPRGFILGLGTHLVFDLLWDYSLPAGRQEGKGRDMGHWFWQVKRKLSLLEIRGFVLVVVVLYMLLALAL